ncbi:MAG: DsbA family protein [Caldilineaceae bacterium]|nr:DsbA family protein [Caldilineaceae bacterium]
MTASTSRRARPVKKSSRSSLNLWLIGAGVFFVALIGIVIYANSRPARVAQTTLDLPAGWVDGQALGNPNAPVTVQIWEDFLCPACQRWTSDIKPLLQSEYINTGDVRLEFHNLPLPNFEPGSVLGAQASLCAADQNTFWPYHDRLFATAQSRGQLGFTLDALIEEARQTGLNERDFFQCMSSQQHRPTVDASRMEAQRLGLASTPSMFINDVQTPNPFDYNAVKAEIDRLLGEN